jgi:hypothetical protein
MGAAKQVILQVNSTYNSAGSIRCMPNGFTMAAYPSLGESALARQNETSKLCLHQRKQFARCNLAEQDACA